MYSHNYKRMKEPGLARGLPTPVWIDENMNECKESNVFGCKVTHDLVYPEMCF